MSPVRLRCYTTTDAHVSTHPAGRYVLYLEECQTLSADKNREYVSLLLATCGDFLRCMSTFPSRRRHGTTTCLSGLGLVAVARFMFAHMNIFSAPEVLYSHWTSLAARRYMPRNGATRTLLLATWGISEWNVNFSLSGATRKDWLLIRAGFGFGAARAAPVPRLLRCGTGVGTGAAPLWYRKVPARQKCVKWH